MGPESACRRWASEATKTPSEGEFGKAERQRAGTEGVHGVREDFAGFCFAWLWVGLGVVVMVFTLLSLPITRKKKTSPIGRQLSSLPWQCGFVSLTVMET